MTLSPQHSKAHDITEVNSVATSLGESPCWSADCQSIFWVDLAESLLFQWDTKASMQKTWRLQHSAYSVALGDSSCVFLVGRKTIYRFDFEDGEMRPIAVIDDVASECRLNDCAVDSQGRLWVSAMAVNGTSTAGGIYMVDRDGSYAKRVSDLRVGNGMAWSPEDTSFYFVDSGARCIFRSDFNAGTGAIGNPEPLVTEFEGKGKPDGMVCDAAGYLWCAIWDGWAINKYSSEGVSQGCVELPVQRPTSLTFGGNDMRALYVTTARSGLSIDELGEAPLSGCPLSVKTSSTGIPAQSFQHNRTAAIV